MQNDYVIYNILVTCKMNKGLKSQSHIKLPNNQILGHMKNVQWMIEISIACKRNMPPKFILMTLIFLSLEMFSLGLENYGDMLWG
jgi:hypothetical protein